MKYTAFNHVIVVMFENEYRGLVMQNKTMKRVASLGADMTNYFGTYHPSQTNYIASIAGEQCGWSSDESAWPLFQQNTIVDLLEASGVEWKVYMEDFPNCPWNPRWATPEYYMAATVPPEAPPAEWPRGNNPSYFQRHNPFASFLNNQFQASRWQRIVNLDQFFTDVEEGSLPQYSWITPNIWNDGHYLQGTQKQPKHNRSILVDQIATWLDSCFFAKLGQPDSDWMLPPKTLVVLTFDESDFEDTAYDGPNRIYTVLLGDMVEPGTVESEPYNHYSLIRTIEENFALGTLAKNDASSNWFRFLWEERFSWESPASIPAASQGGIASASYGGRLFLVTLDTSAQLLWQSYDGQTWSQSAKIGQSAGVFALAPTEDGLLLVYQASGSQNLFALTWTLKNGWAEEPVALGVETDGNIALAAFPGGGAILAYTGAGSAGSELPISSLFIEAPIQSSFKPSPLGRSTSGDLAISTLGSTVYLVYRGCPQGNSPRGSQILVASLETAFFNTVYKGENSNSNTVAYKWSSYPPPGSLYVVGQVSQTSGNVDSPPSDNATLIAPDSAIVMAELDGCIRLMASPMGGGALISQTFSLSGVMTAERPTALKPARGQSLGYGTLMEAGWGPVEDLGSAFQPEAQSPMAMAVRENQLYVFFVAEGSGKIQMSVGGY